MLQLLLLPLLVSGAPPGPCCSSKTVGSFNYILVGEDPSTLSLSCLSPCIYERSDETGGPQYCFARGELEVFCGNATSSESSGAGDATCNCSLKDPKTCKCRDGSQAPEDSVRDSLYWNESFEGLFEETDFINCNSKFLCSSTTDPIHAHVIIRPEEDNDPALTFSDEESCDFADGFIQNSTGNPEGLIQARSSCPDGYVSLPVYVIVLAAFDCPVHSGKLGFCVRKKHEFNNYSVKYLRKQTHNNIPLPCCCHNPCLKCYSRKSKRKCKIMKIPGTGG